MDRAAKKCSDVKIVKNTTKFSAIPARPPRKPLEGRLVYVQKMVEDDYGRGDIDNAAFRQW